MSLPPSEIPQGAIRFNTVSQKLEFYAQGEWWVMSTDTPNLGRGVDSTPGARGVFMGGYTNTPTPSSFDTIDYINIASTGDAQDFADLSSIMSYGRKASSSTRGIIAGSLTSPGSPGVYSSNANIYYITISSTGTVTDFGGDLSNSRGGSNDSGVSNSTRGIFAGGLTTGPTTFYSTIDYVTIASTGDAKDFGDTLSTTRAHMGGCSSPTRGLFMGGYNPTQVNTIDYVTIATLGSVQDFGDLSQTTFRNCAFSSPVRGISAGGSGKTVMEYVTIATTGNATKFGDLSANRQFTGGTSSSTRGIVAGGDSGPYAGLNIIEYVNIQTEGDAIDFGDLTAGNARSGIAAVSNAHGGL